MAGHAFVPRCIRLRCIWTLTAAPYKGTCLRCVNMNIQCGNVFTLPTWRHSHAHIHTSRTRKNNSKSCLELPQFLRCTYFNILSISHAFLSLAIHPLRAALEHLFFFLSSCASWGYHFSHIPKIIKTNLDAHKRLQYRHLSHAVRCLKPLHFFNALRLQFHRFPQLAFLFIFCLRLCVYGCMRCHMEQTLSAT